MRLLPALLIALASLGSGVANAATLDRIKETGTMTLGYRTDAMPFSYDNTIGEPAGYSVELCRVIAAEIKAELKLDKLDVRYVPVPAEGKFDELQAGKVDLICGASTMTLSRREQVDFSLPTFVTGATLLYRKDGPKSFEELKGQKVGVRAGTTTETALRAVLDAHQFDAQLVPVPSHEEGLKQLAAGNLAAYFGDGAILLYQWRSSPDREKLMISTRFFSNELYGLPLPKGDAAFHLAVDRALAGLYGSGRILDLFHATFGNEVDPSDLVKALYMLNSLPE